MKNTNIIENFKEQYLKVFNNDGTIKTCGRKETIKLISLAIEISKDNTDFGNINTGFINIQNIKGLYESL